MFDHDETHGREPFEEPFRYLCFLQRDPDSTIPFVSFSETKIQDILPTSTVLRLLPLWIPDPVTAVDKSNPLVTVFLSHALLSPISDGSQECIMRAIESLLSFAGCLPPLLWNFRTPLPAVDKSNAHVTVSFLMLYFPHPLMDSRNVS